MMIPIKRYEPVRTRLSIKSKLRLIMFLLILCTLSAFLIPKTGTGQGNLQPYTVSYGETYWSIAKQLQMAGYKPRTDIRNIVHELTKSSGIPAHELQAGDAILIPEVDMDE